MKIQKQILLALLFVSSLTAISKERVGETNLEGSAIAISDTENKIIDPIGTIAPSWKTNKIPSGTTSNPVLGNYSSVLMSSKSSTSALSATPTTKEAMLADLNSIIADLDKYFVSTTTEYASIGHTHYANGLPDGNPISNTNINFDTSKTLTIYPGAYYNGVAINFAFDSTITIDGLGDPNAKFIIESIGAINSNINATFKLTNGAQACNVFFLANGGMSIGAAKTGSTTNILVVGNWVSRAGAIAVGIHTNLDGRILTSAGALTMGDGTLKIPTGTSFINLRSLTSFLGFTSAGDVNITGAVANPKKTYITGDVFTCSAFNNFGFTPPYGTGNPVTDTQPIIGDPVVLVGGLYSCTGPATVGETTTTENNVGSIGTFSIYKNGIEIPESTKTIKTDSTASTITLQTIATVNGTDIIDVRWKTAAGNTLLMGNRNLTLIKVQ
jgi:hypothetical protein